MKNIAVYFSVISGYLSRNNESYQVLSQYGFVFFQAAVGVLFIAVFSMEVSLVLQQSSISDLHAASPDEALFIEVVRDRGIWHFSSGNGPVFWGAVYAILNIAPLGHEISFSRIVFIIFKYAAWLLVTYYFYRERGKAIGLLLFFVLLTTPGYLFFGKIVSPEYLLLFLGGITVYFLLRDSNRIGREYYLATILAFLATITKITAFPLMIGVLIYGLFMPLLQEGRDLKECFIRAVNSVCIIVVAWGIVLYLCGIESSWLNISEILSIAPSFQFDGRLGLSWYRDEITWDQISVGGIGIDFLPTLLIVMILFSALFYQKERSQVFHSNSSIACVLFFTVFAMFVPILFRGMAFGWYLFLPAFLFVIALFSLLPNDKHAVLFFGIILILVLFVNHGWDRMQERIELKRSNNIQLVSNKQSMNDVMTYVSKTLGCARTANLDILVPNITIHGFPAIFPARIALNQKARGVWSIPDILIVNGKLDQTMRSPLKNFIIQDELEKFEHLATFDSLLLYAQKSLSCFPGIEENHKKSMRNNMESIF